MASHLAARHLVALSGLALVVAFAFQGSRALWEPTEGRYGEVAREMAASGSWLDPTLDGQPHWSKPPLTYWAIAAGMMVLGPNAWGARAANAVGFVLTALAVAGIAHTLWNARAGVLAGLVYVTSPLPVLGEAVLSTDTLLALWETAAVLAYLRARSGASSRRVWWVRAMWVAFGLGALTKGPVALLPLAAIVVFHLQARVRFPLLDPAGVAVFTGIGAGWYALEAAHHPGLLSYFVGDELVRRNTTGSFHRNPEWWAPFALYLPALLLGMGLWMPAGLRILREQGFRPGKWRHDAPRTFLLLWLTIPLVALFLVKSRLVLYVVPLYAPVAVALGYWLARRAKPATAAWLAAASVVLVVGVKGVAGFLVTDRDMKRLYVETMQASGPGAELHLFDEDARFGFEFYAGRVERVAAPGSERPGKPLAVEVTEIPGNPVPEVFVAREERAAPLERALAAEGIPYRVLHVEGSAIVVAENRITSQRRGGAAMRK